MSEARITNYNVISQVNKIPASGHVESAPSSRQHPHLRVSKCCCLLSSSEYDLDILMTRQRRRRLWGAMGSIGENFNDSSHELEGTCILDILPTTSFLTTHLTRHRIYRACVALLFERDYLS